MYSKFFSSNCFCFLIPCISSTFFLYWLITDLFHNFSLYFLNILVLLYCISEVFCLLYTMEEVDLDMCSSFSSSAIHSVWTYCTLYIFILTVLFTIWMHSVLLTDNIVLILVWILLQFITLYHKLTEPLVLKCLRDSQGLRIWCKLRREPEG